MARKVFISSDISIDDELDDVAEKNPLAALMWPWFLTYFDDWGRAEASAKRIKKSIFPSDHFSGLITVELIEQALTFYHSAGLIDLYHVDGKRYMMIDPVTWFKYQTHIRKEKRDNDNSKHPAPNEGSAQLREGARDYAQISDNLTNCIPSPSPSPSNTTTTTEPETVDEIHRKVFNTMFMTGLMSDYIRDLKSKGFTDRFVMELMLETGESGTKPSLRLMQTIGERWIKEGIYTRVEAKKRKLQLVVGGHSEPPRKAYQSRQESQTEKLMREIMEDEANERNRGKEVIPDY